MKIEYSVQIWKESDHFIAHAMPLDVATSGSSLEEARTALAEAVKLFLDTAAEHGTLVEVLEDAGYIREEARWRAPDCIALEQGSAAVAA